MSRQFQFKLVLLGESAVGKSSLVLRFVKDQFDDYRESTIGAAFLTQTVQLDDQTTIRFEIWDTAGQERYKSLAPMYYRNANCAVVVYDITQSASLEKARSWIRELQRQADPSIIIALNSTGQHEQWLCCFDFDTVEADQFSFKKNDILTIVHKEPTGWWAALANGRFGWVPAAYLQPVPATQTNRPSGDAALLSSSPSSLASPLSTSGIEHDLPVYTEEDESYSPEVDLYQQASSEYTDGPSTPVPSLSPTDNLVRDLTNNLASATLSGSKAGITQSRSSVAPVLPAYAMYSPPSSSGSATRENFFHSMSMSPAYDPPIPHQLSLVLEEGSEVNSQWSMPHESVHIDNRRSVESARAGSAYSPASAGAEGVITLGARQQARLSQANMPWYLKPEHAWEGLKVDQDLNVFAGTIPALVERLLLDPSRPLQEQAYRTTFLTTYKSFTTANTVYETLIGYYEIEPPATLGPAEFLEWKEKKQRPTQTRVLSVLTQWVEQHSMTVDDPQLIPRLQTFLNAIQSATGPTQPPTGLKISAGQLLQIMERVQNEAGPSIPSVAPTFGFSIRRNKQRAPKGEFLKWDSLEVANHLTIMETRAYKKIRPHECLNWTRATKGPAVANLTNFIETSDRVAAWVKLSVLTCEMLGKRADTIDQWIKIAEHCRKQNNIFSMSAIVAALSGGDVGKLTLTWAHVSRATTYEGLVKIMDPTGRFATYKELHKSLEGPCVPFINPFLTELMHINDQFPDLIPTPTGPEAEPSGPRQLVNFAKLRRLSDVISLMLKFTNKPYRNLTENLGMTAAIEQQIEAAAIKDTGFFWQRSQELQGAEVTHADIWRNLNDAGF
ncbi:hypothetical protein FRC15_004927 [Serendipita sp. 397]|nr:hypothetical protein FRC15_004927 [Serendipita sp. 397]